MTGGVPRAGVAVSVLKRDGSVNVETVGRVIWTDGLTVWLCSAKAKAKPRKWNPCGNPGCSPMWCDVCGVENGGGQ